MNNGTSSSTKPSLKWAFMLIFLSTLIVCLLHYYSLTKYSFWNTSYNPDEFAFPKSSCDTQVMKKKYYDLKCMDDWLQHDDAIIMKKVQSILSPEFLQPFINNKENCSKYSITETKNVSNLLHYGVGTSSKYPDLSSSLDLIHHLPHFSEMFFNFFSLKLYLERKYIINNKCNKDSSSKQNPMQLNGIIIEDNIHSGRFWTATTISKRWMKDLVNHVSELSGNQIISSSSCNILPIRTADKTHKYKESTNQNKNTNTVYNIGNGNQMNNWFIHESGAFLLGSLVLKENVCKYRNTASDVIASNQVSFSILNRINDRRILNYKEIQNKLKLLHNSFPSSSTISSSSISHTPQNSVVNITDTIDIDPIKTDNKSKAIPSSSSSSLLWNKQIKNITVHSFEGKSLFYQVQAMRSTDVLLTGHGAGNANIAWMKPCSIVIEVFPWAFYIPNYFGSLAKSAGLLYYSIQESRERTEFTRLYGVLPHCKDVLNLKGVYTNLRKDIIKTNGFNFQRYNNYTLLSSSSSALSSEVDFFNALTDENLAFRTCTRGSDGVYLNFDRLVTVLHTALNDRDKCLKQHRFLAN